MNQTNLFKEYKGVFAPTPEEVGGPTENVGQGKEKIFGYNPFPLQDAIGEKNVKKIWIEYEKLKLSGVKAEDLIYKIVGKVRDMAAIAIGASKENLNIKDYPFIKSKKDLKNWKTEDLKNLYTKLIEIYHRSRMESNNELDIAIEKTLLSI